MKMKDAVARLKLRLRLVTVDREGLRRIIFTMVLALSAVASLFIWFGGQDSFSSPARLWPVRWMMLAWTVMHFPLYLLSRGRHSQAAYLGFCGGSFAVLSVLYQTSNAGPVVNISTEIAQIHSLLFLAMLLFPMRRYLAFSSLICCLFIAWIASRSGHLDQVHGNEAAIALGFIVVAMWLIAALASVLLETYYQQIARAHGELSAFNARLRDEVEMQAGLIRKQQENLTQIQKMEAIGLLAGGIAHDFNNKLTIVRGFGELISENVKVDSPVAGWIRSILEAAGDAGLMTRQLLSFSRREMIAPRSINLNARVEARREVFKRLLGEHIVLAVIPEPALGNCLFDPGQLEEVLVNLVLNARDALGNGGRLEIRTENVLLDGEFIALHPDALTGPHVSLEVRDTGSGMTQETLSHLFEPFFTTKPTGKGTGLGLATVYGIVKQNGGSIYAESRIGQGSSFRIFLPRVAAEAVAADVKIKPEIGRACSGTILVVEDEVRLLELVRVVLTNAGYRVMTAGGPYEAILKSRNDGGEINLLLCDVIMPDGGAGRTVAEISAQRPGIPVLYMSGYADETISAHGIIDRKKNFLRKPFSASDLLEKVGSVIVKSA